MIDMTSWPELEVDVLDDVELDPNNVRLEMPVTAPQVDIMRDIFANGDALSLVEGIVKVGYLTHEIPIVVDRGGKTIVVEGNRRLAALKAIQNPYLVPEYQSRVTALVKAFDGRGGLRTIRVKKAPDQDQANQLIAAIHTSNIRIRWKPARQAAFFQAQVDAGKALPQLLIEYPMSSVRRFVRASQLLNKFKNAPYGDPALRDFVNSRKLVPTTLSRIYESAEFNRVLGIDMKSDGSIKMKVSEARFNRIATFIVSGLKSGEFTSRTLPSTTDERFLGMIAEIERIAAAPSAKATDHPRPAGGSESSGGQHGTGAAGSSGSGQGGSAAGGQGATGAGPSNPSGSPPTQPQQGGGGQQPTGQNRRQTSVRLDSHGLTVPQSYPPAISKIFDELVAIHVQNYPNATMDLLRTFLEKVTKAYARDNSLTIPPSYGNHVQLKDCLVWLNNHVQASPSHHSLSAIINRIQSRNAKQYPTSAAYLNDINHNPDMYATPQDAHDLWEAMIGLMQLMLK